MTNISTDYQDIQIRTLTKWINVQLKEDLVESIDRDLRDGVMLLRLLSIVSNKPALKPERGRMKIHAISNVSRALNFLKQEFEDDENLPVIASEDIVNGDIKSTLAILFFIMLKYQFSDILGETKKGGLAEAKVGLLYWIRLELKDYINSQIIPTIQDFSKSWKSGLLFCLLIHRIEPEWILPLHQLIPLVDSKDNWNDILNLVFDIGENKLQIPKYLESRDLLDIEYPHEPSIMLYISEFYKIINRTDDIEEHKLKRLKGIQEVQSSPKPKLLNKSNIIDPLSIDLFDHYDPSMLSEDQHHLLNLRLNWEQLFNQAVEWIANTHLELNQFITIARWSGKEDLYTDQVIENIIQSLVAIEGKLSGFDQGLYSNILDLYQQMESIRELPDHLQSRQSGFESAFEDLMKRSSFSRKIVEQLLSVIQVIEKFQQLKTLGEELRDELSSNELDQQDMYSDKVLAFKQDSARFIQNVSSCIPYPSPPEMKTAMGNDDLHDNEVTKEVIESTLNTYSMSLALIAEGLDQLLISRDENISLQQRVSDIQEVIKNLQAWFNDKINSLSTLKPYLYAQSLDQSHSSSSASTHSSSTSVISDSEYSPIMNEEELHRLEKDRDHVLSRLSEIENEDLPRLDEAIRIIEHETSVSQWIDSLDSLKKGRHILTDLLHQRELELDALKRRIEWEAQWSKYHSHLVTLAKKLSDLNVKKVRYDPSKENPDKPSYQGDHELVQSFQWIQDRMGELGDHPWSCLLDSYQEMVMAYLTVMQTTDESAFPEFLSLKQSDIKIKHDDLKHLLTYTSDLMAQRSTITEFLMRVHDAQHEGEKIKEQLAKRLRRMNNEEQDQFGVVEERIDRFKKENKAILADCVEHMPYPVYSGNWLQRQQNSEAAATYRAHVRVQIKSLIEKKIQDLENLEKSLDQVAETYREADRVKHRVAQYEKEADELKQWVDQQIDVLRKQHIEVSAESFLVDSNLQDMEQSRQNLWRQVEKFEQEKVKLLHDQIVQLIESTMQDKKKKQHIDVSVAAQHLGEVMKHLDQLKQGLSDQAVTLEAANMRAAWEKNLNLGIQRLEEMNEQLRDFTTKKNQMLSREDISEQDIQTLERDLNRLMSLKNKFEKTILPSIQMSYDAFIEYFPKLPRPMAVPDHLEVRMESLGRSCTRFQENVMARSRELDLVKQRVSWETTVKKALAYLREQEIELDRFIEQRARWRVATPTDLVQVAHGNDEGQLRTEWYNYYSKFETYQDQVLLPIKQQFEQLTTNTIDYDNPRLVPQAKKMEEIEAAKEHMQHILSFSNDVVSQRCLVSAFILRTAQLEQSAELIREEFISTTNNSQKEDMVHLLENHSDRLHKFKAGIDDARDQLAASIPYPVRATPTETKMADEAINAAIHETIDSRTARLSEICSDLEQLLATRERISRRQLSVHSFKKQAANTEAWITARRKVLMDTAALDVEEEEQMEKALSEIMSIQQGMRANETNYALLTSAYEKCKAAFEDKSLDLVQSQEDHEKLIRELQNEVKPTYQRLSQDWNNLLSSVDQAYRDRQYALLNHKLITWLHSARDLFEATYKEQELSVIEQNIPDWQALTDQLNSSASQYKLDLGYHQQYLEAEQLVQFTNLLQQGHDTIKRIESQLEHHQKTLSVAQLTNKYLTDVKLLRSRIHDCMVCLKDIEQKYRHINTESFEARESQHQALVAEYKASCNTVDQLKGLCDDVRLQFKTIQQIKDHESNNDVQDMLEKTWSGLESFESAVATLVSRASSWMQYFNRLSSIEQDIHSIKTTIESAAEDELSSVQERAETVDFVLLHDLSITTSDLLNDKGNLDAYEELRVQLVKQLAVLKENISAKVKDKNKTRLIEHIQQIVSQFSSLCSKQYNVLDAHSKEVVWLEHQSIEDTIDACGGIIEASNVTLKDCQTQLDTLREVHCQELHSVHHFANTGSLLVPLADALDHLSKSMSLEQEYTKILKQVKTLKSTEKRIIDDAVHAEQSIATVESEEALLDLEHCAESLDEQATEFTTTTKSIDLNNIMQNNERKSSIHNYIKSSTERVLGQVEKVKTMVAEAKVNLKKNIERQRIISKLKEIIGFLHEVSNSLEALQTVNKEALFAEFDKLCQYYSATLSKKEKGLKELVDVVFATPDEMSKDKEISELYKEMTDKTRQIDALINIKKKQVFDEGDLHVMNELMESLEEEIALLITAIDNANPKNVSVAGEKHAKSNLQGLLRSLIASYKHHQPKIVRILENAKKESKKQFADDNAHVSQWLAGGIEKWTKAKAAAAVRERELQDCINQLNNEFFNKLAASRPRRVLPPAPATPVHNKRMSMSATAKNNLYT
ncbi:hypothetical protein RMCBS344292_14415 [Rhizopus microsporus]|nr:hypothetical protein RMCBS344292_14415 [Rhizopus microsporus]